MVAEKQGSLGVGLTYWPALEPIISEHRDLIDVLEVQPETLWYSPTSGHPFCDAVSLARLRDLPQPKVVHGVGNPVGGSTGADRSHGNLVNEVVAALDAGLVSEHLSFSRSLLRGSARPVGFMFPPRQTVEGVEVAAASIRCLAASLPVPFAVENGVSYLRPRSDELPDGEFLAAVVDRADTGIVLDLHNAYANERNGRQTMTEFLSQLPLHRVYELHVAGGREHDGFWLDSHSGAMPDAVAAIAAELVPDLPNLRLINLEFIPTYLPEFGSHDIARQLERCHDIWAGRSAPPRMARRAPVGPITTPIPAGPDARSWEGMLAGLVNPAAGMPRCDDLRHDPGVDILRFLVGEFRAGMVTRALTLSVRLLLLHLGEAGMRDLLSGFWEAQLPAFFSVVEAEAFAQYLARSELRIPHLSETVAFELAVLRGVTDGRNTVVEFEGDPEKILGLLMQYRLPPPAGDRTPVYIAVESPGTINIRFGELVGPATC